MADRASLDRRAATVLDILHNVWGTPLTVPREFKIVDSESVDTAVLLGSIKSTLASMPNHRWSPLQARAIQYVTPPHVRARSSASEAQSRGWTVHDAQRWI